MFLQKASTTDWSEFAQIPASSRSATRIVAASNSSQESKMGADYVCDGTADEVEIQAAIDSVSSSGNGGLIYLTEGNYSISNTIIVNKQVSFRGAGMNRTNLILADGANCDMFHLATSTDLWIIKFDDIISIGRYVLSGGELPSMVVMDSVIRLIPGVLGNASSVEQESFSKGSELDYPQYTRPRDFRGHCVPDVLVSGNHQQISKWRKGKS